MFFIMALLLIKLKINPEYFPFNDKCKWNCFQYPFYISLSFKNIKHLQYPFPSFLKFYMIPPLSMLLNLMTLYILSNLLLSIKDINFLKVKILSNDNILTFNILTFNNRISLTNILPIL